jgi:hypothetical protein
MHNGHHLVAKTRHRWTVGDDPQHRFAGIKTMPVDVPAPFRHLMQKVF